MTHPHLTTERLHEMLAVEEKATPGEWRTRYVHVDGEYQSEVGEGDDWHEQSIVADDGEVAFLPGSVPDARIIVTARNAFRPLVLELLAERAEVARLRTALEHYAKLVVTNNDESLDEPWEIDVGQRAREALAAKGGER